MSTASSEVAMLAGHLAGIHALRGMAALMASFELGKKLSQSIRPVFMPNPQYFSGKNLNAVALLLPLLLCVVVADTFQPPYMP